MAHAEKYDALCRDFHLPRDAERQLRTDGFVVLPGPPVAGGIAQLQAAYDAAMVSADDADIRVLVDPRHGLRQPFVGVRRVR
jgi:hypothetical protein